jgi:hypothetical protein
MLSPTSLTLYIASGRNIMLHNLRTMHACITTTGGSKFALIIHIAYGNRSLVFLWARKTWFDLVSEESRTYCSTIFEDFYWHVPAIIYFVSWCSFQLVSIDGIQVVCPFSCHVGGTSGLRFSGWISQ